jgi:hypothetical protein
MHNIWQAMSIANTIQSNSDLFDYKPQIKNQSTAIETFPITDGVLNGYIVDKSERG